MTSSSTADQQNIERENLKPKPNASRRPKKHLIHVEIVSCICVTVQLLNLINIRLENAKSPRNE